MKVKQYICMLYIEIQLQGTKAFYQALDMACAAVALFRNQTTSQQMKTLKDK